MRQGIIWMTAILGLCNLAPSHAQDAPGSDPLVVTKSFLAAWAAGSADDLIRFMASDAVIVGSSGAKFAGEGPLRQVLGRLKGLQNRDYEVRLDGDTVKAHGKTFGFVPYVELGVEPGEWDSSTVVKNGRITYYEWHYTPEFNTKLEQACLQKPDYLIAGARCLDFSARAKAHTDGVRGK